MVTNLYITIDDYKFIDSINMTCKSGLSKLIYRGYAIYTWVSERDWWVAVRDTEIVHNGYLSRKEAIKDAFKRIDAFENKRYII